MQHMGMPHYVNERLALFYIRCRLRKIARLWVQLGAPFIELRRLNGASSQAEKLTLCSAFAMDRVARIGLLLEKQMLAWFVLTALRR